MRRFLQFYFICLVLCSVLEAFPSYFMSQEYYFAPLFLTLGCLNIFLFKVYIQESRKDKQAAP